MSDLLLLLSAFAIGSVPFAIVASRLFGLEDPRRYGSGNPGATNVLRSGHKGAALVTLIGDAFKGFAAVWLARWLGSPAEIVALCGLAAFLGHVYSVFLRFKGGKGVATALGVIAGFSHWVALICLIDWLIVAAVTRYSSLAALSAALIAPVAAHFLVGIPAVTGVLLAMLAVLVMRHAGNIQRLRAGTEGRIGRKAG